MSSRLEICVSGSKQGGSSVPSFRPPAGGSSDQDGPSNSCKPIMVCLPTQPNFTKAKENEKERKPVGLITRYKDMELFKGKLVYGCTCGRRNGLAGEGCPRMSCMNNPGCTMNPPQCWPQFQDPPKPKSIPDQKMICVPIKLIYYDPPQTG